MKSTMYINSNVSGRQHSFSDSHVFRVLTKGYKPGFSATKDTTIKLFEGNSVTLSVQAEGRSPLNYSWFKGASVLEGKNSDTLQINSFTVNDSASYKCIVTNEYGKAASRLFILKYRPFSGGVKGIVTDLSGNKLENASVTLLPSNKNNSTDTAGLFAFSSLSRNTYTLKISLPQYHDMTLSEIAVNDSETIVLPTIILKMIASATYEVTYNGNGSDGGTVPVDTAHYKQGNRIAVAAIGDLSKAGYSFTNWNMKRDGSGDSFAPGDSFTIRDAVTFHAQWTALPVYKITYNRNGADTGTVPIASNSYYRGKEVTVAGNPGNLHKEGYSFSGWNLKTDGTGETYNAGGKFSMPDSAVTLYVKWTTNPTWSIIYHDNTSTGGAVPAVVTTDSGTTNTIADSGSLYKTGYTFVERNTKEDGSGKAYKTGDNFIIGNLNIDLYAQWTKAQFTITYHGNGNTSGKYQQKKCLSRVKFHCRFG